MKTNIGGNRGNSADINEGLLVRLANPRGLLFLRSEGKALGVQQRKTDAVEKWFKLSDIGQLSHLLEYLSETEEMEAPAETQHSYRDIVEGLRERIYINLGVSYTPLGWLFQDDPIMYSSQVKMSIDKFVSEPIIREDGIFRNETGNIRFATHGCEDSSLLLAICGNNNTIERLSVPRELISIHRPKGRDPNFSYVVSLSYEQKLEIDIRGDIGRGYGIGVKIIKLPH